MSSETAQQFQHSGDQDSTIKAWELAGSQASARSIGSVTHVSIAPIPPIVKA